MSLFALITWVLLLAEPVPQADAALKPVDRCRECHAMLDERLGNPAREFADDIHGARGFTCADCHGGNPREEDADKAMDRRRGFRGALRRSEIPELCARCHADGAFMRAYNPSLRTDQLEVFTRKRLRILLDNPAELRLPIQDLSVPMPESAWASFLERFGARLERLMLTQLEGVEKQLARLQFFQDCATPLTSVIVLVKLNREHSPAELGHFRILVQVLSIQKPGSLPTLCLAGRDGHPIRWRRDDQSTIMGVNCRLPR